MEDCTQKETQLIEYQQNDNLKKTINKQPQSKKNDQIAEENSKSLQIEVLQSELNKVKQCLSESEHSNTILKEQVNQLQSENQKLASTSKSSANLVSAEMYLKMAKREVQHNLKLDHTII